MGFSARNIEPGRSGDVAPYATDPGVAPHAGPARLYGKNYGLLSSARQSPSRSGGTKYAGSVAGGARFPRRYRRFRAVADVIARHGAQSVFDLRGWRGPPNGRGRWR